MMNLDDEMAALCEDAERYRYLKTNNLTVLECVVERRGFRSTYPGATREVWTEREGWTVSDLPITLEPFATMDEAIDASRARRQQAQG